MTEQDIIKAIECCIAVPMDCSSCPYIKERGDKCNKILYRDVISLWKRRTEWIDANAQTPKKRGRYIVMLKTDGNIGFEVHEHLIRILYFGSDGWRLPHHYPVWIHEALKQEVTHWMPLPEPPKEGK